MGTGAECEARIEVKSDDLAAGRPGIARTDPQPLAEAHRLAVSEPLALPGPVCNIDECMFRQVLHSKPISEIGAQGVDIQACVEQAADTQFPPQGYFARSRLELGVVAGVTQGDGLGPVTHEDLLSDVCIERAEFHDKFSPIHRPVDSFRITRDRDASPGNEYPCRPPGKPGAERSPHAGRRWS